MENIVRFKFNERRVTDVQEAHALGVENPGSFPSVDVVYVSGTGDDTGLGTIGDPYRTVYKAREDTETNIIVLDGVHGYYGTIDLLGKNLYAHPGVEWVFINADSWPGSFNDELLNIRNRETLGGAQEHFGQGGCLAPTGFYTIEEPSNLSETFLVYRQVGIVDQTTKLPIWNNTVTHFNIDWITEVVANSGIDFVTSYTAPISGANRHTLRIFYDPKVDKLLIGFIGEITNSSLPLNDQYTDHFAFSFDGTSYLSHFQLEDNSPTLPASKNLASHWDIISGARRRFFSTARYEILSIGTVSNGVGVAPLDSYFVVNYRNNFLDSGWTSTPLQDFSKDSVLVGVGSKTLHYNFYRLFARFDAIHSSNKHGELGFPYYSKNGHQWHTSDGVQSYTLSKSQIIDQAAAFDTLEANLNSIVKSMLLRSHIISWDGTISAGNPIKTVIETGGTSHQQFLKAFYQELWPDFPIEIDEDTAGLQSLNIIFSFGYYSGSQQNYILEQATEHVDIPPAGSNLYIGQGFHTVTAPTIYNSQGHQDHPLFYNGDIFNLNLDLPDSDDAARFDIVHGLVAYGDMTHCEFAGVQITNKAAAVSYGSATFCIMSESSHGVDNLHAGPPPEIINNIFLSIERGVRNTDANHCDFFRGVYACESSETIKNSILDDLTGQFINSTGGIMTIQDSIVNEQVNSNIIPALAVKIGSVLTRNPFFKSTVQPFNLRLQATTKGDPLDSPAIGLTSTVSAFGGNREAGSYDDFSTLGIAREEVEIFAPWITNVKGERKSKENAVESGDRFTLSLSGQSLIYRFDWKLPVTDTERQIIHRIMSAENNRILFNPNPLAAPGEFIEGSFKPKTDYSNHRSILSNVADKLFLVVSFKAPDSTTSLAGVL